MKTLLIVLALFSANVCFAKTVKRAPSSDSKLKCSFDNNGDHKTDMTPTKSGMMGWKESKDLELAGHSASVGWYGGSPEESQTQLVMTLDDVTATMYDLNPAKRSPSKGPINVLTTKDGKFRLQCWVE